MRAVALVVCSLFAQTPAPTAADLNAKAAQLEPGRSTFSDARKLLGEPIECVWGEQKFSAPNLPDRFIARYSEGLTILIAERRVWQVRFEAPGYRFENQFGVGSPLEEAVRLMGPPVETISGPLPRGRGRDNVVYTGEPGGFGMWARPDWGVQLFIRDSKISAVYLVRQTGGKLRRLPRFDPDSPEPVELQGADLSGLDVRDRLDDLLQADFSTATVWPAPGRVPPAFNAKRIMELGTNPGLGIRSLHEAGITGRGVSIAIIDNPLNPDHKEYAGRLRHHEHINTRPDEPAHMHGAAVVSIAAGATLGVAPGADVYYFSTWPFTNGETDYRPRAEAVRRVLALNRTLAAEKKIRLMSMSIGWGPKQRGADEMTAAAAAAKAEGMLFVCSNIEQIHGFKFHGLGRQPLSDPDRFESYEPGAFWAKQYDTAGVNGRLLVPMDARTTAGPNAPGEYVFYRRGGWSWSMPYIAGVYALAIQVDPSITPERFWDLAMKTGRTIRLDRAGQVRDFGPILDPVALIAALKR